MSVTVERQRVANKADRSSPPAGASSMRRGAYAGTAVLGLLLLDVLGGAAYALIVAALASAVFLTLRVVEGASERGGRARSQVDKQDVAAILAFYVVTVGLFGAAFSLFESNDAALFLTFAAGLLLAVGGPIYYTVWMRGRRLASLGLSLGHLRRTLVFALIFASIQFAFTLWGYELPAAKDWVPLLGMSLMVGFFEAVFFRGFVQGRLQASLGPIPAVFGAAALYALYHMGYGMPAEEMLYLFGLGVVYAFAYLAAENILVLWPLLTPLGGFFAQLEGGELQGKLPWASLAGFADVLAIFAVLIWLAHRHERRALQAPSINGEIPVKGAAS